MPLMLLELDSTRSIRRVSRDLKRGYSCEYDVLNSSSYYGLNDHPLQQEIPVVLPFYSTHFGINIANLTMFKLSWSAIRWTFLCTSSLQSILYAEAISVRSIRWEAFRFVVIESSDSFEMVIFRQNLALRRTCRIPRKRSVHQKYGLTWSHLNDKY